MSENKVSSLLITREDKLVGIVTDRDLRNRVVAKGTELSLPVSTIMTEGPAMIHQYRTMFDAMSMMSERNIHHLPVIDRHSRQPMGMITASLHGCPRASMTKGTFFTTKSRSTIRSVRPMPFTLRT